MKYKAYMSKLEPSAADLVKVEADKRKVEEEKQRHIRLAGMVKEPIVGYTNPILILPTGPPRNANGNISRKPAGFKDPPHFD